jgi:hypothetical protein
MNQEIFSGQINNALAQAIARGTSALNNVPVQLKSVMKEGRWRSFTAEMSGQPMSFASFRDFATALLPGGLETALEDLRFLCAKDTEALELLDEAWETSP